MSDSPEISLDSVFLECEALGLISGFDFFVKGHPAPLSSEVLLLPPRPPGYAIVMRDMGDDQIVATAETVAELQDRFL